MADSDRELSAGAPRPVVSAPELPYRPRMPRGTTPGIAVIGCGGIVPFHLRAYRRAGFRVVALCDVERTRAEAMRDEYFPEAIVYTDYRDAIGHAGAGVVDAATHPVHRVPIIEAALNAGRHVLSQKPFCADLEVGQRLVQLAEARGLCLAVNQNGRWAPHLSYLRQAVGAGLLGELTSLHAVIHWDHNWTADTAFNDMRHLLLYDFAIHWFDFARCCFGARRARRVYASIARASHQRAAPPLLGQVNIDYDGGQAALLFNGAAAVGPCDETHLAGTRGAAVARGRDLGHQTVTLHLPEGDASVALEGTWFEDGFLGTMAELMCAIEESRTPENSARHNLASLELCFAAVRSADTGESVCPGEATRAPE